MINLNKKMFNLIQINSQESMLLKLINIFYENLKNVNEFISIINSKFGNFKISIRLIDYFITKYSKIYKIGYKLNDNNFIIYQSYKQQLKSYKKKNFDPFARGIRIPYFVEDVWIITTIGQLNFFRWFISKNLLEYILINKTLIEIDMNHKNKINKKHNKMTKDIIKKKYKPMVVLNKYHYNHEIKKENVQNNIIVSFN